MLKLKVNDKDIEIDEGLTVLQACEINTIKSILIFSRSV